MTVREASSKTAQKAAKPRASKRRQLAKPPTFVPKVEIDTEDGEDINRGGRPTKYRPEYAITARG